MRKRMPEHTIYAPRILALAVQCTLFFCIANPRAVGAGRDTNEVLLFGQQMSSNRNYQFFFEANAAQNYPIEVSFDLVHWSSLTNVVGVGGSLRVQDEE